MPPPCYLAQARPAGAKVDLAAGAALRALLEQPLGSKPEERAKARQDLLAKVKPLSSAEVAWAALLTLGDIREPSQDQIRLVDDFLRALPSPPRFAETFLLHRLAEWEVRRWPGRTVGHLLQAAGDAGLVLAADPNALVWFREPLAAAAEKRRAGERLLFEGRPASYPEAEARLEDARRRYQEVRSQVELLVEAQGVHDRAVILLPGYEQHLAAVADLDPRDERAWTAAVRATGKLHALLARPLSSPLPSHEELRSLREELELDLDGLGRRFQPGQIKSLTTQPGSIQHFQDIQILLAGPRLGAAQRALLWEAGRVMEHGLHERTLTLDRAKDRNSSSFGSAMDPVPPPSSYNRALHRARLSLDLLQLAGLPEPALLEEEWTRAAKDRSDAALETLAQKLAAAWNITLPQHLRARRNPTTQTPSASAGMAVADLFLPTGGDASGSEAEGHRPTTHLFWRWLAEQLQAEAAALPQINQESYRGFYEDAAQEYRRRAH